MKNTTIRLMMILAICATFLCSACSMNQTGNTEVGVRVKKFGSNKGVEQGIYAPGGTYFFPAFTTDWYVFDTKLQNMEMTHNSATGDRKVQDDLLFKTIDGNDISLDVIIAYRVIPEKAPFILEHVAEDMQQLREKVMRTIARSKPRDIFGELKTEEFYVSEKREAKAVSAKDILNEILNPMGVIVEKVLTKDYRFNKEYQKAIEDKKVADQQVQQNKSTQHATLEEYKTKLEDAKGEVNKMTANADGIFQKAQIEADVYYEQQEMLAQAIQAEGIADAEGITKMNKALAGIGGETMVKLKIADALHGKNIIILPVSEGGMNLKTTNINDLIDTLGVKAMADGSQTATEGKKILKD